jgi:DNA-binding CsgD family transcriptional regulator
MAGSTEPRRFRLEQAEVVVGKDATADFQIPATGVSRRHFKIVRASTGIYNLIDLGSTNGVVVNGVQVDVTILRDADRIRVGPEVVLLFTYDENAAEHVGPQPSTPLSDRQLEVARLVCEGLTNTAVAQKLGISPRTVSSHLDHIYDRLDIGSRAELARYLASRRLL